MPDADERLLEPLRIALRMEAEGRNTFAEAARRASGRHARQTFEFLTAEEDRHIEKIKRFYESLLNQSPPEIPELSARGIDDKLNQFERQMAALKGEMKPARSDIEAFRFALSFENGAEAFYRKQIETTHDDRVREFYRWLVKEEGLHGRVLASCLQFVEDPAAWYRRHDSGSS
jgi:rubrerythrin